MGVGSTDRGVIVSGDSVRELNGSLVFNNSMISDWWVSHLRKNEKSDVRVEVSAVFEVFGEEEEVSVGSYSSSFGTDIL